jgi:membrane-associated phospholipid phosphatase
MLPVVNTVSSNIIKPLFHRSRPSAVLIVNGEKESVVPGARLPPHWEPLGTSSFPSSHSAVTAATATLLIWAFRRRTRLAWLALLLPLIIGYSRVYVGVHYPSDVLAGWTLGFALTAPACALLTRRQHNTTTHPSPLEGGPPPP